MLHRVDVGERSLAAYRGVAPDRIHDEIERRARGLRRARVLHVNATPYGGGVSELLRSLVPLLNDLGLVAEWKIIQGDDAFFQVTKRIHNALQGARTGLGREDRENYASVSKQNAALLEEEYDFVFLHDPQPAGLLRHRGKGSSRWIWRCHIDTSRPEPDVWAFLRGSLEGFDAAVFTMAPFVPPDLPIRRVEIVPPAIDPLSPKNFPLPNELSRQVLEWIGVRTDGPLVTQVSRFDPWKDPLGVIEASRIARSQVPGLRLALVGSMALDDPEGWEVYRTILSEAERDPWVHVFTNLTGVGNVEVNAFQRLSSLVLQKSIREGFGLVVSEALWKGTPVVAGRSGGIPLQVADGVGGVLVETVEECAEAMVSLLRDEERRKELGRTGRERVREHFLLPRLLLDHLLLLEKLAEDRPIERADPLSVRRDPVCGMTTAGAGEKRAAEFGGKTFEFCSEACRLRFLEDPPRYVGS